MTPDARSAQRAEGGRISGDMLWFNNEKGHGFIETATGDRLRVEALDFRMVRQKDDVPAWPSRFGSTATATRARAQDVTFPQDAAPRRARIRRSAGR